MLPVSEIERSFATAWPALETISDKNWSARFSNGLTRRANCIQCGDPSDDADPQSRLEGLARLYTERALPALFRVTPQTGRHTLDALTAQGWTPSDQALIFEGQIGLTKGIDGDCVITAPDDADFLAAQARLQGYDEDDAQTFAALVAKGENAATGLTFYAGDGTPLASMLCVETGGIGVPLNVVTGSQVRNQGYGRRLMISALSWLGENGASHMALQVAADNPPAIALYLGLGLNYRYPYHYCRRPETVHP